MSNYKNTLNLPQTDFPMKANLTEREPQILAKWQTMHLYQQLLAQRLGKKKFILHMGPPYANGHIHLGTATTTLLKDMIAKSKSMSGFSSPLVPGWDCHGLPIEHNVEKKIGRAGDKVSPPAFRQACRDYATSFVDIQREEFKRLGIIADWENPYLTMAPIYEANIIRSFTKIIKNKHLQKGFKPVHWCLACASALAEAEVEYMEKESASIDVKFQIVDAKAFWDRLQGVKAAYQGPVFIPIWTTTPWSLPGNEAVALNPSIDYVVVLAEGKEAYVIAEALLSSVLARYQIQHHEIMGKVKGEALTGLLVKHPFYAKDVPVILGDHVTVETGTGAVHTAPAHGLDDYLIGKAYQLPLVNPIGDDGCFTATTPLFAGIHVNKANGAILEALKAHQTLIYATTLKHSYPHCWRHKTPLIYRATPQWFISMEQNKLREHALKGIQEVNWIPEWAKSRIEGMIASRPDWCISRQRTWGVPIPLFVHKQTGELHPQTLALLEKIAEAVAIDGIEAWYSLDTQALLGEAATEYTKVTDVLDVWFDSGVSHECVLREREELYYPADIILEGSDQHRGWFQSSLLTAIAMNEVPSYREVLTHGFVVDANGHKMSKSIGNVIAPEEVIQKQGADILRLWVASVDYRTEITASKELLSRVTETYRRIRNTTRFLLANMHGFDPEQHLVQPHEMIMLDRWIVDRARLLQKEICDAYMAYQFHVVVQKVHQFCLLELGSFYLDIIKDRQYTMPTNSRGRRSAQTALFHVAQALTRWIAPILSFTAEEIWMYLPKTNIDSIMLTTWYEQLAVLPSEDKMNQAFWEKIRLVRDAVNKAIEAERNNGKLGSALEAEVTLYCAPDLLQQLTSLGDELRFVLITSKATVVPEHPGPTHALTTDVPGLTLKIEATTYEKCERCWHRVSDVNSRSDYPGICLRCVTNIEGLGEERDYA